MALRPYGLTAPMWRVLNGLAEGGPSSIGDIARHTAFERSYVSRLVGRIMDGLDGADVETLLRLIEKVSKNIGAHTP